MKTPATRFKIEVNGTRFSEATVSLEDQLEVNLVSLAGQEAAVLAVTAFIPGEPKGGNYVRSENLVLTPGNRVEITLSAVEDGSTNVGAPDPELQRELSQEHETGCSFCGKSSSEVERLIAGSQAFICDECVLLCQKIIREEV